MQLLPMALLLLLLFLKVVLDQRVYNGVNEVNDHRHHKILPDYSDEGACLVLDNLRK